MDISAHHDDCSHHYRKAIWNHRFVNILLRLSFLYSLWIATTLLSLLYIIKRHIIRNKIVYLLHLSFILILSGALTTHIWGIQGNIHLRQGETPVTTFNKNDGQKADLPFSVSLKQFQLTYYQGTFAPMDSSAY